MTAQQAFEARVEEKIQSLRPYLVKTAKGDEGLIQEGAIGIWEAMRKEPEAGDGYFKRKAKYFEKQRYFDKKKPINPCCQSGPGRSCSSLGVQGGKHTRTG